MQLFWVMCSMLALLVTGVRIVPPPASEILTSSLFMISRSSNNTNPSSTDAFFKTHDLDSKGVWPYVLEVRGDLLASTASTEWLLKRLFAAPIPSSRLLSKSHLQVYLGPDKLPTRAILDQLNGVERLVSYNPLAALPIGARIDSEIFDQVASAPPGNVYAQDPKKKTSDKIQLLVTVRTNIAGFRIQAEEEIRRPQALGRLKFMRDYASNNPNDRLVNEAFPNEGPNDRFSKIEFEGIDSNTNRTVVDVTLQPGVDVTAATFYLSFFFASNSQYVTFVEKKPAQSALASWEASYIQNGATQNGVCDGMDYHELFGQGQIIGLADSGIDLTSSYLYSKTGPFCSEAGKKCGGVDSSSKSPDSVMYNNATYYYKDKARVVVRYDAAADTDEAAPNGHGTFLAGVMSGIANPAISKTRCPEVGARGVAFASKIAFYDIGKGEKDLDPPADDYTQIFRPGYAIGARLFTVAWGSGDQPGPNFSGKPTPKGTGLYTAAASDIDSFMVENNEALVVVAAGNSGPGFVTSPAISKNALTVGALSQSGTGPTTFSAGGKQPDGRMKPDLIAMGDNVVSAASRGSMVADESHCQTTKKSGTSVSAAIVTAAAAQVRQYFEEGYYPSGEPSEEGEFRTGLWGSTIKAVLIAGASPLVDQQLGGQLGTEEGYGSLMLGNVLPFKDDNQIDLYIEQGKASMGSAWERKLEVNVKSDDKPLVVTLAWTDPPTTRGARSTVINQLELAVVDETHNLYWSTETSLEQNGNVKRFYIAKPTPGRYSISIKPTFVRDTQDFSVVVVGRFSSHERSSPLCCAGGSYPGLGACMSLDTVVCIILVSIIGVIIIIAAIVIFCRSTTKEPEKQDDDELYPL